MVAEISGLDESPNVSRSPCPTCGGIVWIVPAYDPRPIDQAEYRCAECTGHTRSTRVVRRRVMLFSGRGGPDQPPIAVPVDGHLRPTIAATIADDPDTIDSPTDAESTLDLRPWRSWLAHDGTEVHSRVWHLRGQAGGTGRPPELYETLDEWFERLPCGAEK